MSFYKYLKESEANKSKDISLDEFIEKIKKEGLYGYDVLQDIDEDELRKIISDDKYFSSKMKSGGGKEEITEMVVRPGSNDTEEKEIPKQNNLSLAVRMGLKQDAENNQKSPVSNSLSSPQKETPQSFSDRLKAEYERRKQEQEDRAAKEKALRDERAKRIENESNIDKSKPTFAGKELEKQYVSDDKTEDKVNDDLDKELTDAMFKRRSRANTKVDNSGYKKVTNLGSVNDKAAKEKLEKEIDKKYPTEDKPNQKLGNSQQPIKQSRPNTEYSKRTLLAISDRMDFDVYCKFIKANGQTRTGNFRIGKTTSQITKKQSSIVVVDLDLTKKEKKTIWRTIPLERIIKIQPL